MPRFTSLRNIRVIVLELASALGEVESTIGKEVETSEKILEGSRSSSERYGIGVPREYQDDFAMKDASLA